MARVGWFLLALTGCAATAEATEETTTAPIESTKVDPDWNVLEESSTTTAQAAPDGTVFTVETGRGQARLRKYAPDGTPLWEKKLGEAMPAIPVALAPRGLAIGPSGNVVVFGDIHRASGTGASGSGTDQPFLLDLDAEGVGTRFLELGPAATFPSGASIDALIPGPDGGLYLSGGYRDGLELPGKTLAPIAPGTGTRSRFVALLDAERQHVWSHIGYFDISGLAASPEGDLFITGESCGPDFGAGRILTMHSGASSSDECFFVAKLDRAGRQLWGRGTSHRGLRNLAGTPAALPDGGVALIGAYDADESEPLNFGGGGLPRRDGTIAYLVAYDAAGAHAWSTGLGALGDLDAFGAPRRLPIAVTPSGDLWTSGACVEGQGARRDLFKIGSGGVIQSSLFVEASCSERAYTPGGLFALADGSLLHSGRVDGVKLTVGSKEITTSTRASFVTRITP